MADSAARGGRKSLIPLAGVSWKMSWRSALHRASGMVARSDRGERLASTRRLASSSVISRRAEFPTTARRSLKRRQIKRAGLAAREMTALAHYRFAAE